MTKNPCLIGITRLTLIILLSSLLTLSLPASQPARAATLVVDRFDDEASASACTAAPNDCSLRGAISYANTNAGDDIITLPAGTYTLSGAADDNANVSGDLDFNSNIVLNGAGAATTIIDGNDVDRVMHIRSGATTVVINDVTITNGNTSSSGLSSGGGLLNGQFSTGSLALNRCVIINNETAATGHGGGVYILGGRAIIHASAIKENLASTGAGILVNGNPLQITNSTISGNQASSNGGGLYAQAASATNVVTITNSTISGNTAERDGGGIYVFGSGNRVQVSSSTIANNTADANDSGINDDGGGIFVNTGIITLTNSILADNQVGSTGRYPDCSGELSTLGYNLIEDLAGCTFTPATGDITGQPPALGALADNGGSTQTHALQATSPALDAGEPANCRTVAGDPITSDQRGATRPVDGDGDSAAICDIGAYEAGEMQCPGGLGLITFNSQSGVQIQIGDFGTNLACLYVDEKQADHPNATSGGSGAALETGKYWTIEGYQSDKVNPATDGYSLTITLPHSLVDDSLAKVCKYPGNIGGDGWDCQRTDSTSTTVTRVAVDSLSDWAVGENVGPTAVTLNSLNAGVGWSALAGLLGVALVIFATQTWPKRRRHNDLPNH